MSCNYFHLNMILGEGVEYGQETGPSWTLSCVISYWQVKRGLWVKWESKRLGKRKAFVFLLLNFMWLLRNKDFQTLYFGYYILSYQAFKDFYIEPLYDLRLWYKSCQIASIKPECKVILRKNKSLVCKDRSHYHRGKLPSFSQQALQVPFNSVCRVCPYYVQIAHQRAL